ncbi:hypothetical protein PGTUg99_003003 [Puccinia graminis f. sp. tritici]|uniref:Uncharacterized protein n=1 Tax=Puccinia graminis f. sp. tritici TaxID=56615 RepID=A0A5B0P2F5_PUCGR|nr:hypothetical protein PGTUg99_003003 [Puccinia graminis f. sp. tritici]
MEEISPSNSNRENSNAGTNRQETSSPRQTPESETNLLDYSEAMMSDTPLVPPPPSGFESLGNSLPSITDTATRPQEARTSLSEQGISPALINSRATSLALETMSNRSTPVPRPIDRLTFPVNMNTAMGRLVYTPTPRQTHQTQVPALEQSLAPLEDDMIVDNQELETVVNLFNEQWNMFVQARDNQNPRLMRLALIQAISSQEEIRLLAGGAEMLRICENWIAREELADLERSQAANPTQPPSRLAITQTAHQHTVSPSPAPQRSTRQPSDVTYLGTGPVKRGNDRSLPPPPPSTPHPLDVAWQEQAPPAQRYYQQPQPQYRQEGQYLPQPQPMRIVQNYAPTTQQQVQAVPNHTHQPPHHQPPHRGSRGSGRNWRRPRDQTTTLIEVGQTSCEPRG